MKREFFYATKDRQLIHIGDGLVHITANTRGGSCYILSNNDVVGTEDDVLTSIETGERYFPVYELCYVDSVLTREHFVGYTNSGYSFGTLTTLIREDLVNDDRKEMLLCVNRFTRYLNAR